MLKTLFRERWRSLAVRGLGGLNAVNDSAFDRYVNAAAAAFGAPISVLSLIQDDRQSIWAAHGFELACLPRDGSFCRYTLDRPGLLECCDPLQDERFADLPSVVGDPHVRYYIGAPLTLLTGIDVGALCVVDTAMRPPASADQKAYLLGLARQASMALEARLDIWGNAA